MSTGFVGAADNPPVISENTWFGGTITIVPYDLSHDKRSGSDEPAPATHVGREPEGTPIEEQSLGWKSDFGTGNADNTVGSGIEGAWKPNPTRWDMGYLKVSLKYEWELKKSPAWCADRRTRDAHQ